MHVAIIIFDGFNELDSLIASCILHRVKKPGWRVSLSCLTRTATSMNGVTVSAQSTLEDASAADAVIIGSGNKTRDIMNDPEFLSRLKLDPARQLIGAQCSGAMIMAKLDLIGTMPVCTDLATKAWLEADSVHVLDQPFHAQGNLATAGGCLSAQYLAAWIIARVHGEEVAKTALYHVCPVGEKEEYAERALRHISPFLPWSKSISLSDTDSLECLKEKQDGT